MDKDKMQKLVQVCLHAVGNGFESSEFSGKSVVAISAMIDYIALATPEKKQNLQNMGSLVGPGDYSCAALSAASTVANACLVLGFDKEEWIPIALGAAQVTAGYAAMGDKHCAAFGVAPEKTPAFWAAVAVEAEWQKSLGLCVEIVG